MWVGWFVFLMSEEKRRFFALRRTLGNSVLGLLILWVRKRDARRGWRNAEKLTSSKVLNSKVRAYSS